MKAQDAHGIGEHAKSQSGAHAIRRLNMKRYLVIAGWVKSKNDHDKNWVNADQLMQLYRVNPAECVVVKENSGRTQPENLIVLRPRRDGDYG